MQLCKFYSGFAIQFKTFAIMTLLVEKISKCGKFHESADNTIIKNAVYRGDIEF